jgi:signal transduction histidine kinase
VVQSSKELLERYQDRMTDDQRSTHFQRMGQQIHVMLELLQDILTLSKASAGVLEFSPTPTDVHALCDEIVTAEQLASGNRVPIRLQTNGEHAMYQGDSRLLRHAITNLLSNAVKYSPDGSDVLLGLDTTDPAMVVITVRDQGIGIPEADRAKLFDPFFRASNVGKIEGTGLGLAIVQHSVSMHGGAITCDKVSGAGTRFTMRLPLLRLDPVTS